MTETLGVEMVEPDGYLQPRKVRVTYQCDDCGKQYKRVFKAVPKADPPCPNPRCAAAREVAAMRREVETLKAMIASGSAPAQIGAKTVVKAVDETAKIVMEDYGMTNLRDGIRPGESVAPKLPPQQQAAADGYFGGKGMTQRGLSKQQVELLGRRAAAGAYRNMAVAPTEIAPGARTGESPLRVVRRETVTPTR